MMNPIFASGLRRRMRSPRTVVIVTLYAAIMLFLALLQSFSVLGKSALTIGSMRTGVESYVYLVALQFLLIVLVAPGMTSGSIAGERERQTLDLVLVTNTGSLRIALGKLMESFAFLALLILSSLPMMCVVFLFGGVSFLMILKVAVFMMISAFAALSIGLLTSSLFKRTITATVMAYLAVFAIGVCTLIPMTMNNDELMRLMNNPDLLNAAGGGRLLSMVPKLVFLNPGIGLVSLMINQTGILQSTFGRLPSGYSYFQLFKQIDFELIAYINMGVMLAVSMLLIAASAFLVRPRIAKRRSEKSRKELAA